MQDFIENLDTFRAECKQRRFGRSKFMLNFTDLSFGKKIKAAQTRLNKRQSDLEKEFIIDFIRGLTDEEIQEWLHKIYSHVEPDENDCYR